KSLISYRHAFYPRRGRQTCTLQHVMPLYNVYPLFTICVLSPVGEGLGGFDPFDPRLLSIKLDVVLSLNGLEVSPLSHCIYI
ncbi:hypothetical protein SFRURICE_008636, partial [Spodoptera frugiperda]